MGLLPAWQSDFQRLQPLPVQRGEGGHHRARPIPRAGAGRRLVASRWPTVCASRHHCKTFSRRLRATSGVPSLPAAVCADGRNRVCYCSTPPSPCVPIRRHRMPDTDGRLSPTPPSAPWQRNTSTWCLCSGAATRKKKGAFINRSRHLVLSSAHPSPPLGLSRFLRQPPFLPRQRLSGAARETPIVW